MATAATAIPIHQRPFRRIYVWELPIRVIHWINALGITILAVTGFLIGWPHMLFNVDEPYQQYWFGWVRFLHFAAAYVVFFAFLFRVYWGFVGNKYARWSSFFPHTKAQFVDMWGTIRVDILQLKLKGKISVGHNYMASLTYVALFLVLVFMTITGFGLYADMSSSFIPHLFTWIVPLMGGDAVVRKWHHIFMWVFVLFTIIHVYLAFYHDYVEGRGDVSSMLGGWKFDRNENLGDE